MVFIGCIVAACISVLGLICKGWKKDDEVASGCLTWLVAIGATIGVIVLILVGYAFYSVSRFIEADTKWYEQTELTAEDKERWSYNVYLPEAEHCFEYYSVNGIRDQRFMVETRAYSSVEEMCTELPEGCQEAIMASLRSTSTEEEDIRGMDVKQYKVNDELLPLITWDEVKAKYDYRALIGPREYYVDEYEDGTYRFVLCVQTF